MNWILRVTLVSLFLMSILAGSVGVVGSMESPWAGAAVDLQTAARPSLTPYGVNDWNWKDDTIQAAKEAGITWMRISVNWRTTEQVQGQRVWSGQNNADIDFYISQAEKYGMQVTASVFNAPDWARQPGLFLPRADLLADFVKAFLLRYPGRIAAVEILAEDNTVRWPATENRDSILYPPILKAAYLAAKAVSPNTLVVTSSLWGSPEGYLEDLYTMGAGGYFDVVNFHYYPGKNSPTGNYTWWISHLRKVMEKYGDGSKPIWLTEFAWTTTDENRIDGAKFIVSPQDQSDYMRYVLDTSMKSGIVEKVFWYLMHDDDGMALMHATDNYAWKTPQPGLTANIQGTSTTLTVEGDWTRRWPEYGYLELDNEYMSYTSLTLESGNTVVRGLVRGVTGTAASSHTAGATVYNRNQTTNFKRRAYYTYAAFSKANPTWTVSKVGPLPDVPPPASTGVSVTNPGFENGTTGWWGVTLDTTQSHSGTSSAVITNTTGRTLNVGQRLPLEPGKSYFLRAWVKIAPGSSGIMNAMVKANLNDSSGKFVAVVPGNYYIYDTKGDWREIHYAFKTPANVKQMSLVMSTERGTGTAWFDDISVEPYPLQ